MKNARKRQRLLAGAEPPSRGDQTPPGLRTYEDPAPVPPRPPRKTLEPRRFSGRNNESVAEFLAQFEITAKINRWTDDERALNLLYALDSPARSLLTEVQDMADMTYAEIKQALTKRFGPIASVEIHEQTLQESKLSRGQSVRELASEVNRIAKLAYPELDAAARSRFAIKYLVAAIGDKEAMFYIRDKNPRSTDEVCEHFERYKVLTGHQQPSRKGDNVRSINATPNSNDAVAQQLAAASQQIEKLTSAVEFLMRNASQGHPNPPPVHQQNSLSATAPPFTPNQGQIPRKPCPAANCQDTGHVTAPEHRPPMGVSAVTNTDTERETVL